jgi:hypothetical protein
MVLNIIDAEFEFNSEGLIIKHTDTFNFYAWAKQALGIYLSMYLTLYVYNSLCI